MRDLMASSWGIPVLICTVCLVWGVVGLVLSDWRHYMYWNPQSLNHRTPSRLVSVLFWLHRIAFFVIVCAAYNSLPRGAPTVHLLMWCTCMAALIDFAVACRRAYQERRDAGDSNNSNLRRGLAVAAVPSCTMVVIVFAAAFGSARAHGAWAGPWWILFMVPQWLLGMVGRKRFGAPFLLEPTPLLDEIVYIGKQFGSRLETVHVVPAGKSRKCTCHPEFVIPPQAVRIKGSQFATLIDNIVRIEMPSFTAMLALRQASAIRSGSIAAYLGRFPVVNVVLQLVLVLALLSSVGLGVYRLDRMNLLSDETILTSTFAVVCLLSAVVFVFLVVARYLGYLPSQAKAYPDAFQVWSAADGGRPRSIEDFSFAMADYLTFSVVISRPEVIYLKLMHNRALCRLVRDYGQIPEHVFRAAVDRLGLDASPAGPAVD